LHQFSKFAAALSSGKRAAELLSQKKCCDFLQRPETDTRPSRVQLGSTFLTLPNGLRTLSRHCRYLSDG
jgi:hypothetical protein